MIQEKTGEGNGNNPPGFLLSAAIGAGAGAAVLMEFGPKEAQAIAPPKKWDKEAGVVIVGTGQRVCQQPLRPKTPERTC